MGHALPCLIFQVRGEVWHLHTTSRMHSHNLRRGGERSSGSCAAAARRGLEDVVDICSRQVPLLHLLQGLLQPPSGPGREAFTDAAGS